MSEDVKKDIIDTQKAKEFATSNGKNDAKSLEQFVVSILQTNKTIFCIALAFSIFLYFQPVRMPFSHYFTQDGFSMTFEYFSKKVNGYSTFLFITEIFLTAFAITRFLQMINIVDIIMRMPLVCDLIFWLRYEDRVAMRVMKKQIRFRAIFRDFIESIDFYNQLLKVNKDIYFYDHFGVNGDYEHFLDDNEELMNFLSDFKVIDNHTKYIILRYALLRFRTIHYKGYFYEKNVKNYIIEKLKMEDEESKFHKLYNFLTNHRKALKNIALIAIISSILYALSVPYTVTTTTLLFSSFSFFLLCL
jgi:hypothetical protein